MSEKLNRRHVLRGVGTLLALPALESIGFRNMASAESKRKGPPPKRMVFLGMGFGVTQETWYPDPKKTGANYSLPEGLKPLQRHKSDFTVVQGCHHQYSNEAHWGSTFWLTGANRYAVPGSNFSNTISADQVAARQFGKETRFSSIQLVNSDKDAGHGPGLSLAWDQKGKPIAGLNSPLKVFHKLFSAEKMSLKERQALIADRRSVLDTVLIDAKRVQQGLTKTDTDKLDEYFEGIRSIENQLSKRESWLDVPKPKAPMSQPPSRPKGREEMELMYDLIVAAFQTDSTRVMTYRQILHALYQDLDVKFNAHNVSHYVQGERMDASQLRDKTQSELLAKLIDKLKSTKEADGSSLFDHTTLTLGSNIRSIHYLNNCPTLIAGRGAKLKMGQHLVLKKNTPLCNVWLTMLKGSGVNVDSHGDSTGLVKELMA